MTAGTQVNNDAPLTRVRFDMITADEGAWRQIAWVMDLNANPITLTAVARSCPPHPLRQLAAGRAAMRNLIRERVNIPHQRCLDSTVPWTRTRSHTLKTRRRGARPHSHLQMHAGMSSENHFLRWTRLHHQQARFQ